MFFSSKKNAVVSFFEDMGKKYENFLDYLEKDVNIAHEFIKKTEAKFLSKIIKNFRFDLDHNFTNNHHLEEALKGAHIKFDDDGSLYDYLVREHRKEIRERSSSHSSCEKQYSFSGFVVKEVLFGVHQEAESGKKMTWVQFEKNNTKTWVNFILHMFDYVAYKLTGNNIGPYGSSSHTDSNPLVIKP
jgi:hypothetical protein